MDVSHRMRHDPPHDGAEIEQRARALVAADSNFVGRVNLFEFEFKDNGLAVRGTVPSFYIKQVVQRALKVLEQECRLDYQIKVAVRQRD